MFEGPVTGNIPEVLDNGEVTDGTHVTAGQLALALTPYAQVTELAVNTAASGNNAAAIQSLDARVTAELASKLDSSALAPAGSHPRVHFRERGTGFHFFKQNLSSFVHVFLSFAFFDPRPRAIRVFSQNLPLQGCETLPTHKRGNERYQALLCSAPTT